MYDSAWIAGVDNDFANVDDYDEDDNDNDSHNYQYLLQPFILKITTHPSRDQL